MKNNYTSIEKIAKRQKARVTKEGKEDHDEIILETKNLNLFYDNGKTHALKDITFDIYRNNVTSIIGPSGCGKSSFLRCINRMNDLIENTDVEGELNFEGANIYGKQKKLAKEEKQKLATLRNKLLKYKAASFFEKSWGSFSFNKKKQNSIAKMDELINATKKETSDLKKKYFSEKAALKIREEELKKKDLKAYGVAKFSNYKSILDNAVKYDLDVFHSSLDLFTKEKEIKRSYVQRKREIKNHLDRKIMEEENRQSEKNIRTKNRKIKDHFSKDGEYDALLNEYENQLRKLKPWKPAEVRTKIGLVFQKPNPFAKSIFENIAFALRTHGISDPWVLYLAVEKSLRDAALWDEVKDRLHDSALSLSGGQQQRLCIARAISLRPKILLMDEPTASLDPIATAKIEELIKELREKYTIIIVTHSMQQATRISDYTAFFYQGQLIEFGETHQVFRTPNEEKTQQYITGKFG